MKVTEAIEEFELDWKASGKSLETIRLYKLHLQNLVNYLNDPDIDNISQGDLKRFMVYLREEHVPNRLNGDTKPYSDSAISNHWKALRSLFKFCHAELGIHQRPDKHIPMPKYQLPEVKAFTDDELRLLTQHIGKVKVKHSAVEHWRNLQNEKRNRAILYLLLETGMRVGELCRLEVGNVSLENGDVEIRPFGTGQKTKPRHIPIGNRTLEVLNQFFQELTPVSSRESLFQLTTSGVRTIFYNLGKRAGVEHVHPHRFRHTFAINFLRHGGDIFRLRYILGHSSWKMVNHYLDIVHSDLREVIQRTSSAERLCL